MKHNTETWKEEWVEIHKLSDYIKVLQDIFSEHGDVSVSAAYDGDWGLSAEIHLLFLEHGSVRVVVGRLS